MRKFWSSACASVEVEGENKEAWAKAMSSAGLALCARVVRARLDGGGGRSTVQRRGRVVERVP
jgi:hypothetical protein